MKSYIRHISLLLLACLGMTSCTEQDLGEVDNNTQGIELSVNCVNLGATRAEGDAVATKPGETDYNENLISSLHYFLYESGKTNQPAVLTGHFENINAQGSYTLRIPLEEGMLNTVFPRPIEKCEVYLIANLPKTGNSFNIPENTSLANLKTMVINSTFQQQVSPGQGNEFTEQSSFVMDGQGVATIENRKATIAAKGSLQLDRLASKFSVRISVEEYYTDTDGTKYVPDVTGMQVHLVKASQNTTLAAPIGSADCDYVARKAIKDANGNLKTTTVTKVVKETNAVGQVVEKQVPRTMYLFDPFYSYPREWEYKAVDALVLHVMLPWKKEGEDKWEPCNYKVFPSVLRLDRNNWYNVDLHIGVLGSFQNEEATWPEIEGTYRVQSWNNGTTDWGVGLEMDTEILGGRYLVVEQTEYVVNNQDEFEIPFISSHTCTIEGWTVSHKVFVDSKGNHVNDDKFFETGEGKDAEKWLTLEGNTIKLSHELNNDFLADYKENPYDYTPYEFTCTLRHVDNPMFSEVIKITQKPALSVTAHLNSYDHPGQDYCGYVFVNGNSPRRNSNTGSGNGDLPDYGGIKGRNASEYNTNPYMYTVEVTVLPAGSDFIIGDPRVEYTIGEDLDAAKNFYSYEVNKETKSLTNYYGTSKDAATENMIAPKFRVCSAHGWCSGSTLTYMEAFNRAASYQEDGYPAGRWRVPTKAEIQFVNKLFEDTLIPGLFYGTYAYWYATGKILNGTPSEDLTSNNNVVLRCVYDDWYWEHSAVYRLPEGSRNVFTWGDEVTNN